MKVALVNPPIVTQKGDLFSTGIPYVPLTLLYLTSYLRSKGHETVLVDAFGEAPRKVTKLRTKHLQGLTPDEVAKRIPADCDAVFFYAGLVATHETVLDFVRTIRAHFKRPIIMIENTQSVVAYALKEATEDFFAAGVTYIITGEPEERADALLHTLRSKQGLAKIDGLIYKTGSGVHHIPKQEFIKDLDALPFPAFDLLNLKNYWKLGYAHAPLSSSKYLPILTSRGCPYPCAFCVVPATNNRQWRFRSAQNVADEMEYWYRKLGVREFHVEDLNPTINKFRIKDLCAEILRRNLPVRWKIAAGTKIEHIDLETAEIMAQAGCVYLSFSPETGSTAVSKLMKKPFNHDFGIALTKKLRSIGVRSQACFVIGFPGETNDDRAATVRYLRELVAAGLDEAALFIMTPIPGSAEYGQLTGYDRLEQLTFTPSWRADFKQLQGFRKRTYLYFIALKLLYQPGTMVRHARNVLSRRFETKTEMAVWRALRTQM